LSILIAKITLSVLRHISVFRYRHWLWNSAEVFDSACHNIRRPWQICSGIYRHTLRRSAASREQTGRFSGLPGPGKRSRPEGWLS